jgi:hypothetical protein
MIKVLAIVFIVLAALTAWYAYQRHALIEYVADKECAANLVKPIDCLGNGGYFNTGYTLSIYPLLVGVHFRYSSNFGIDCFPTPVYSGDIISYPGGHFIFGATTKTPNDFGGGVC